MCGICGYIDPRQKNELGLTERKARLMMDAISHRGPDDSGLWTSPEYGIALGFRRLAILDLSVNGHQPMVSADQQYVIIFNGEIYNYLDISSQLERRGYRFKGHSDTEVMLAAFTEYGIEEAVRQLNGMFSIALWDRQNNLLHLIRDRLGVKPLYYGWNNGCFFFASELKAIKANPNFQGEIDLTALGQYLQYSYVPSPRSIYQGIHKLPPGSMLTLRPAEANSPGQLRQYWELPPMSPSKGDKGYFDTLEELEGLLKESVRLRMIADVPLGAFLSGGVDSSAVVALMQAQSTRPIKTFTIGFEESEYDEAGYAKAIASHLGTDHTELYVTPQEAMDVIPMLPQMYDEPFGDSSQIPTYLVSKLARQEVTVSLSGDGGDELFQGYNRYRWAQKIWNSVSWLPGPSRNWLSSVLTSVPISRWDTWSEAATQLLPQRLRVPQVGDKVQKLAAILENGTPEAVYYQLVTFWDNPSGLLASTNGNDYTNPAFKKHTNEQSFEDWMSWIDIHSYLPDDILAKVDRASMAVGLEARVPLIDDHRIVEFASRLPRRMKQREGKSKWLLRQLLYKYVPPALIERPKMGFGVPINRWLRGPLRPWAESLLDPQRIKKEGILNPEPIQKKWLEHQSGSRNWQYHLWNILMFQAWLSSSRG